jgi:16S rRNA processing protein RimM
MTHGAPDDAPKDLVALAAVARGHGLAGEVLLKLFNPDSDFIFSIAELTLIGPDGERRALEIQHARPHGRWVKVGFAGVTDRNASDALRGQLLYVGRDALPAPEEGEYYHVDLVGLQARDRSGSVLGPVVEVLAYPTSDCLVVERESGRWEIPTHERYMVEVDIKGGFVVLDNLAELEELQEKGS